MKNRKEPVTTRTLEEKLNTLNLGQEYTHYDIFGSFTFSALKVPGGWIFSRANSPTGAVFVPQPQPLPI